MDPVIYYPLSNTVHEMSPWLHINRPAIYIHSFGALNSQHTPCMATGISQVVCFGKCFVGVVKNGRREIEF